MSSFPLTNSIIFQDGYCTTNQISYSLDQILITKKTTINHYSSLLTIVIAPPSRWWSLQSDYGSLYWVLIWVGPKNTHGPHGIQHWESCSARWRWRSGGMDEIWMRLGPWEWSGFPRFSVCHKRPSHCKAISLEDSHHRCFNWCWP